MKFTLGVALSPVDQLVELARTAEEYDFSSIALPDSIFYSEDVAADYPYTPDSRRFWTGDTPWVDPLVAAAAMGAATSRIRFSTQVLKLGPRNPVLLARQVGSVANLTGNRFGLGVGLGWTPEEFEWCGAPFADKGPRADEAIEVLRLILGGGMVDYHGRHFEFGKLRMSPAPTEPVPIYVGGHSAAALRPAARTGDGWTSAMMRFDRLRATIDRLAELRRPPPASPTPSWCRGCCTARASTPAWRPSGTACAGSPARSSSSCDKVQIVGEPVVDLAAGQPEVLQPVPVRRPAALTCSATAVRRALVRAASTMSAQVRVEVQGIGVVQAHLRVRPGDCTKYGKFSSYAQAICNAARMLPAR